MSRTWLLGPNGFPNSFLHIDNYGHSARFVATLNGAPNLSLLWHRYMPAHDKPDYEPGSGMSPFDVDVSDVGPPRPERPTWGEEQAWQKKRAQQQKQVGDTWAGFGAIEWFTVVAENVRRSALEGSEALLQRLSDRRFDPTVPAESVRILRVESHWRTAVGLGNAATFENSGVALHGTYGFPILPGASIKGLASHYAEQEYAGDDLDDGLRRTIFGIAPEAGSDASEGAVAFFDGWPVPGTAPKDSGWFDVDVLTVHHKKYYEGASEPADDTEKPVPVHFLTLRPGVQFEIPLALTAPGRRESNERQPQLLDVAEKLVHEALAAWGIGAKTGAGYGRFRSPHH